MKKISVVLVVILVAFSFFLPVCEIKAKTMQDLYNQLDNLKKKKQAAENGAKLSEEQIKQIIDTN